MRCAIIFMCVLCAAVSSAEDFVLVDGTVLQDARLVRKDADSAVIGHSTGVQRVSFDRLPSELQERFGLTPQAVNEFREKQEQARRARVEAEEKLAASQRAALEASALSPRYLSGADVMALYSTWDTLSAVCAEYLAADWNRREALRCNLTVEADRYTREADRVAARMNEERNAVNKEKERVAALEAELQLTKNELKKAKDAVNSQREEIQKLSQESSNQSSGTVVISHPTYVPVYRPAPIIVPPIVRPQPPPPPRSIIIHQGSGRPGPPPRR